MTRQRARTFTSLVLASAFIASLAALPVVAQDWRGRGDWHGGFHGGGYYYNYDHWRGGNWYNGFHEGRNGWWWIVDGGWYFYPAPIYPYPDPYTPPTVVVEQAPAVPTNAPPAYLYYCADPAGYYPAVPQCPSQWQKVASASVAQPPQPVVPTAQPSTGGEHDVDVQQLNVFAARLQNIDANDKHARAKLKDLGKQVEAFRQSLYNRDYNAMDVMRNAEDLKKRIDEERSALLKHAGSVPTPPTASASPSSGSPPPGTTVTFPPQ